jgi:hypothetical protein
MEEVIFHRRGRVNIPVLFIPSLNFCKSKGLFFAELFYLHSQPKRCVGGVGNEDVSPDSAKDKEQ